MGTKNRSRDLKVRYGSLSGFFGEDALSDCENALSDSEIVFLGKGEMRSDSKIVFLGRRGEMRSDSKIGFWGKGGKCVRF